MDETFNTTLPLVITVIIVNHSVVGILVDYESSYNLMYLEIFRLGLLMHGLKPCEGKSLIIFNDSLTQTCGTIDLPLSFK